jgi:hypothetical protein
MPLGHDHHGNAMPCHAGVAGEASNRHKVYAASTDLKPKHVAFCRVEPDNSTLRRGWEVVYVYDVDTDASSFSGVYVRPAAAGEKSLTAGSLVAHWPDGWWTKGLCPFSYIPPGKSTLKDWEFNNGNMTDVVWSGPANGTKSPWKLRDALHCMIATVIASLSDAADDDIAAGPEDEADV